MKTFKQFQEETQQLDEALPAVIPLALKLGGMALSAYSAGSALNNLRKGKYKQAAFDAMGAIPGGRVFKGIRALGGAKNLAKAGSFVQSANRFNLTGLTPNAYAKGFDAVTSAPFKAFAKNKNNNVNNNKNATQTKIEKDPNAIKKEPNKYAGKTFKTVTTSMKLGGDKKKDIVKGGGKVGDAVSKTAKDMIKK